MLSIYPVAVELLRELRPAIARIETSDRDLARQMRRAAASVLLNLAEGSGSFGGTGRERFRSSLGSLRETDACLDVAVALGSLNEDERRVSTPKLGRVAAALVKLAR